MANLLGSQGEFEDALEYLNLALQHSSNTEDSRHTRLRITHYYHSLNREPEAVAIYGQLLQLNPNDAIASHMLDALAGTDVSGKPEESYVKELFFRFSESFDECLDYLGYQAPRLIGEMVSRYYPGETVQLRIMDAGCGTGLCGNFLRKRAEKLVGVDFSPGMLKQAEMLE